MEKKCGFDDLSVLIIGFDGYKDVWDVDIDLMNKYWSDRPKTYLATSELIPDYKGVEIIQAGAGSEWSRKAQCALDKINTSYVLLMLEDFFITDYVDNSVIESALRMMKEDGILFYQILVQLIRQSWEKGKPYKGNKEIIVIPEDKKYGINLQAAIWETDFLRKTIGNGNYNAWQFEVNQLGTRDYNAETVKYLIDKRNILNITHAIVQSKYLRSAVKKLKRQNVDVLTGGREQLSASEDFKYNLKLFMYSATPKKLVKPFKQIGRAMKVDFVTDRIGTDGNKDRTGGES